MTIEPVSARAFGSTLLTIAIIALDYRVLHAVSYTRSSFDFDIRHV